MDCEQARRDADLAAVGGLNEVAVAALHAHTAQCRPCDVALRCAEATAARLAAAVLLTAAPAALRCAVFAEVYRSVGNGHARGFLKRDGPSGPGHTEDERRQTRPGVENGAGGGRLCATTAKLHHTGADHDRKQP